MSSSQLCSALQHQYPVANQTPCWLTRMGSQFTRAGSHFVISFNCKCTYQAELSKGSDQEKASFVLAAKQRVVKLVCHWVALYGLLLKEDPVVSDFLEVRFQPQQHKEVYISFISGFNRCFFPPSCFLNRV